ncbi:putative kinase phosphatase [Erwinia phage phiEa1H]|uniref:Putative kinase-phosphatase n=1 Tax=Erwinia phage phiEa100 TaxID=925983 RepID=E5AGI8_9CAUD|nr:polynucleotide kinase [Erwinia phage phiEa100]CBX44487.1 putative kinase phosphatase [Erwinia phage phiEa1H]CBX45090.1 putative kinase-phosphatase [Erwinia phage phiEa100]
MSNISANKAIVFDLDGTLSDGAHRLHLLPKLEDVGDNKAWDAFNLASKDDLPIQDNIDLCNILGLTHRIVILTGRSEVAKDETLAWLDKHGVNYDNLIMRGQDDNRKDIAFKEAILKPLADHILCAFDDLEHVAEHIRSLGITCHLVTKYPAPLPHQQDHRKEEA